VAALIIHRLTGIQFSFTARGTDIQVDRHMLKEKLEAAEFAIAVSSDNKKIMVDECGSRLAKKIHVIHGGVDVSRLVSNPKRGAVSSFRILCVARFEEVKGHAYLVEACKLLRERGVPFECRLVGDGPLMSKVKRQIQQAGLQDAIHLLGAHAYPEVIQELRQADVVALPTAPTADGKREGIPNVLKEAMACGLPVLASAVGGIPELVEHEHTGILLRPRDAVSLADALQRLSTDRALCERLGEAAREKVAREFNLRTSTAQRTKLFLGTPTGEELICGSSVSEHVETQAQAAFQSA
jgi:glycosyltransferase involved in cell wall biosynthesis